MKKICGIYKITCLVNNKTYVGQSNNIYRRWYGHKSDLRKSKHYNEYLQKTWDKYGEVNFKFEIIEECNIINIDDKEKYWITYCKSSDKRYGYNIEDGGNKYKKVSEETRRKISKNRKGKATGERHQYYGKQFTEEHKKKLSKNHRDVSGKNNHFYGKSGERSPVAREIICLTTGKVFHTGLEAGAFYNIDHSSIYKCCKGKRNYCGKLEDGTKLVWQYYDEYKQLALL